MSSGSSSRASSIGPSSFTENLTLYMNGNREHVSSSLETAPERQNSKYNVDRRVVPIPNESINIQALRDELEAALRRHNELLGENARLKKDLEKSAAETEQSSTLRRELKETLISLDEIRPQLETARRQAKVNMLRVEELEAEVGEHVAAARQTRERQANQAEQVEALELKLEAQESRQRERLEDDSLIDELEDELERTRHELDRMIKDKKRIERQMDCVQSDLKAEQARVEELEKQLTKVRMSKAMPLANDARQAPITSVPILDGAEIDSLRAAMGRTDLRLDGLESQLQEAKAALTGHADRTIAMPEAESAIQQETATSTRSNNNGAMDRAEAYIRKLKAREQDYKNSLQITTAQRDNIKLQLVDAKDDQRELQDKVGELTELVEYLQDVKERMGRVLMYQWGKDEIGEIERRRRDGKRERGMGYKYKYFKKDGTVKEEL